MLWSLTTDVLIINLEHALPFLFVCVLYWRRPVTEISWLKPGSQAGSDNLQSFIDKRLKNFADLSNDPNQDVCSHMSAYFNMGQVSAQAALMRVKMSKRHPDGIKAFVEQAIVRRELSDNLCFYNREYLAIDAGLLAFCAPLLCILNPYIVLSEPHSFGL